MHAEYAFGTSSAVQAGEDREIDGETTTALHLPWQVVYCVYNTWTGGGCARRDVLGVGAVEPAAEGQLS
jgi:hypothetical protein